MKSRGRKPTQRWKYGNVGSEGFLFVVVMIMLFALCLLGGVVFTIFRTDLRSVGYHKTGTEALYHADAGARYILDRLRIDLQTNSVNLDQAVEIVNYESPPGFKFDTVTNLIRLADGKSYLYRVTGRAMTSMAGIEVVVSRPAVPSVAVFGEEDITLKPGVECYSYVSSEVQYPSPADSTDAVTVGTNGELDSHADAVHGTIYLGADEGGVPATYTSEGGETIASIEHGDRIAPDPIGVVGGLAAQEFFRLAVSNDNVQAVGGTRVGNVLTIEGNVTLTAGDYYVDEIDLKGFDVLTIDASGGSVNVYLTGGANTQPNVTISVNPPLPGNFRIISNSSETINLQPKTDLMAVIYAPLAEINVQPNGTLYGAFWGRSVKIMPGGEFFADEDALNQLAFGLPAVVSWKDAP